MNNSVDFSECTYYCGLYSMEAFPAMPYHSNKIVLGNEKTIHVCHKALATAGHGQSALRCARMMAFIAKAKVNDQETLESYVFTGLPVLFRVRTMRIRALLVV
jgi:hypothetical protein